MKKFLSIVFALVLASTAFAQNVLEITDISQPNDVYSSEDNKAVVVYNPQNEMFSHFGTKR